MEDQALPSLSQLLECSCLAEVARRLGVPRPRVWRLRHGISLLDDTALIVPLARVLHRTPEYITAVVDADYKRREAKRREAPAA